MEYEEKRNLIVRISLKPLNPFFFSRNRKSVLEEKFVKNGSVKALSYSSCFREEQLPIATNLAHSNRTSKDRACVRVHFIRTHTRTEKVERENTTTSCLGISGGLIRVNTFASREEQQLSLRGRERIITSSNKGVYLLLKVLR